MLILECSIRMYGVMYGVYMLYREKISNWAFSFGQQMCQKEKKNLKILTQKKCPMGLIKYIFIVFIYLYISRTNYLLIPTFVLFFFFFA